MTVLDDKMLPKILAAIAKVGVSATWNTATKSYNRTTGVVTDSGTNHSVTVSPPPPVSAALVSATIESTDTVSFLAGKGLTFTPKIGDLVTYSSAGTYEVLELHTLYSGDSVAAYKAILRD